MRNVNEDSAGGCLALLIYLTFVMTWVINLIKLINCDFDAPYKEEIVYSIGLFLPPTSIVTAWF